jgi:hypothetical protein
METASVHSSKQDLELVTHGMTWKEENELRKDGMRENYVLIGFFFSWHA